MADSAKDRFEEPVRSTARGVDPATPARALTGVTLFVGAVAVVLIVALLILWYALK
jgi:hypothetical protein